MGELAKNTVPPAQVCLVMQTGAMQLQIDVSVTERLIFSRKLVLALKYEMISHLSNLSKGFQCGSEIILPSIGLVQVFCVTRDITCQENVQ